MCSNFKIEKLIYLFTTIDQIIREQNRGIITISIECLFKNYGWVFFKKNKNVQLLDVIYNSCTSGYI